MINELATDYVGYLKSTDLTKELAPVEETIEDMLTRLDEFESLVDMVRNDGCQSMANTAEQMLTCKGEMKHLCERIDSLEIFVARVKQDLEVMEAHMDAAEADVGGSDGRLKNILKPLFFKKPDPVAVKNLKSPPYEAPQIFKTSDFFTPEEDERRNENSV